MTKVKKYTGMKGKIIVLPNETDAIRTYTAGKIMYKKTA